MGRTTKYKDNLLLDAVIRYSDVCKKKIKATELAEWARKNIKGLEDVNDYNFTRPVKNPKTGKLEKRLCTQRMEELNASRDIRKKENENPLIGSVNIDRFYELDERSQRNAIVQMRDILSEYRSTNAYLRKQNSYLNNLLNECNAKIGILEDITKEIQRKQAILNKQMSYVRKHMEEDQIRGKLEEIGIADGGFDLIKYNESLRMDMKEMLNIEEAIKVYQRESAKDDTETKEETEEETKNTGVGKNYIDELTDF